MNSCPWMLKKHSPDRWSSKEIIASEYIILQVSLFARSSHMSLLYMKKTNYSTSSSHQKDRYRKLSPKLRKLTYVYPLFVMLLIRLIRKFYQASMDTISHIFNVQARTCGDWLIKDKNLVKMMPCHNKFYTSDPISTLDARNNKKLSMQVGNRIWW